MNKQYIALLSGNDKSITEGVVKDSIETGIKEYWDDSLKLDYISEVKNNSETPQDFFYRRGYFKALLDFKNMVEGWDNDSNLRTKKKYSEAIKSYLKLLCEDSYIRDDFMEYGGNQDWGKMGIKMDKNGKVFKENV